MYVKFADSILYTLNCENTTPTNNLTLKLRKTHKTHKYVHYLGVFGSRGVFCCEMEKHLRFEYCLRVPRGSPALPPAARESIRQKRRYPYACENIHTNCETPTHPHT